MFIVAFLLGGISAITAQKSEFQAAIAKDPKAFGDYYKWQEVYHQGGIKLEEYQDAIADGSDFVFEGRFLKYQPLWEDTIRQLGYIALVDITHIYKGDESLKKGTVEIFVPCNNCTVYDASIKKWTFENGSDHAPAEFFYGIREGMNNSVY